jgi:uncharacterized repeat protein (TIGR03803 family)
MGKETLLHSFRGGSGDGANPYAGMILDSTGNLYGTTLNGGKHGAGTVFKIGANGKEVILFNFSGGKDGGYPYAGVIRDKAGNLYGTTYLGGNLTCYYGCGTVYKLSPQGKETVLYRFPPSASDGAFPYAGLIRDGKGNLYGTTLGGGDYHCQPNGCGAVFKLNSHGKETFVYLFQVVDAESPYAGLIRDASGNLYGTTSGGGGAAGQGTVFKFDAHGNKATLYSFSGTDGSFPISTLIRDSAGNLFGTTLQGGAYYSGEVFKIDSEGNETTMYNFAFDQNGGFPWSGLVEDPQGNFFGTTSVGGTYDAGTIFELTP